MLPASGSELPIKLLITNDMLKIRAVRRSMWLSHILIEVAMHNRHDLTLAKGRDTDRSFVAGQSPSRNTKEVDRVSIMPEMEKGRICSR